MVDAGGSPAHRQGMEPSSNAGYLQPQYWEQRFKEEESYDWFKQYSEFRHLVVPHLKPSDRILVLGCGNSTMTADLWRDGFRDITSIDLSQAAVDRMAAAATSAGMKSLKWQVADMLDLPFADGSFDVVVEKGTMDVLFVDNDSPWDPRPEVQQRVHRMLAETHRVLTAKGMFLSITFAQPHFRRPFFTAEQYSWGMQHQSFGETFHYFVYNLQKGAEGGSTNTAGPEIALDPEQYGKKLAHEHMDEESYLMRIDL